MGSFGMGAGYRLMKLFLSRQVARIACLPPNQGARIEQSRPECGSYALVGGCKSMFVLCGMLAQPSMTLPFSLRAAASILSAMSSIPS